MKSIVVIGTQWGDEGKGKIVDFLAKNADIIVRFQGGDNAGHIIIVDDKKYRLNLLPCGILHDNKVVVIGNGVVLNPVALMEEIGTLQDQGVTITPNKLKVSSRVPIILQLHKELDEAREARSREYKIGTTKKGIGPAYEDKVGRRAIHLYDLKNTENLAIKIENLLSHHNPLRIDLGLPALTIKSIFDELNNIAPVILPYISETWLDLQIAIKSNKKILFEGAQGAMLDIDHGNYPYVTSSNTFASQASIGSGIASNKIDYVIGLVKAYTSKEGSGPFPTELHDSMGDYLRQKGAEFSTITGKPRRIGWLDAVAVRQIVEQNGISALVMTKADVLDGVDEIKICTGYNLNGIIFNHFPASLSDYEKVEPIYEVMKGWKKQIDGINSLSELPTETLEYIKRVEELVGAPVIIFSTSPKRANTIVIKNPFDI